MKKSVLLCAVGLAAAASTLQAQEMGRVISSSPVIQQVAVPRQVCNSQPMAIEQPTSGAGALMGAIAGGAMGNAIGGGSGRAAATALGLLGGALVGNRIEGPNTQVMNQSTCTTQTFYENRATAYNVTYEYAGKQYSVQLPYDPGPTVQLQVTPVGAAPPQQPDYSAAAPPVSTVPQATIIREVVTVPQTLPYATYPYPAYYERPYYPPLGLSLNFGWVRGGHRHHHHHHGR